MAALQTGTNNTTHMSQACLAPLCPLSAPHLLSWCLLQVQLDELCLALCELTSKSPAGKEGVVGWGGSKHVSDARGSSGGSGGGGVELGGGVVYINTHTYTKGLLPDTAAQCTTANAMRCCICGMAISGGCRAVSDGCSG